MSASSVATSKPSSASIAAHADAPAAETGGSEAVEQPVLVVLLAGSSADVREREQRFVAEVGLALDVANLLDNEHYEFFGGDLLGRRTMVSLTYGW